MIDVRGMAKVFTHTVLEAKETLVKEEGVCTDIAPTYWALWKATGVSVMGQCNNVIQRGALTAPNSTRWMALCRQVTALTGADMACAAVELLIQHPATNEPGEMIEAIELTVIDREDSWTQIRPYTYDAGREVIWWPAQAAPENILIRGTALEMNAFRQAFLPGEVAYPASVKYLSQVCGTHWTGHPALIERITSVN